MLRLLRSYIFFFNDTATTEIYTLSLHDALPISAKLVKTPLYIFRLLLRLGRNNCGQRDMLGWKRLTLRNAPRRPARSEEHTSELQSRQYLVCRLLLEKKKTIYTIPYTTL